MTERWRRGFSEVHIPTRELFRRTVLIWRIAVKVNVICGPCELV